MLSPNDQYRLLGKLCKYCSNDGVDTIDKILMVCAYCAIMKKSYEDNVIAIADYIGLNLRDETVMSLMTYYHSADIIEVVSNNKWLVKSINEGRFDVDKNNEFILMTKQKIDEIRKSLEE